MRTSGNEPEKRDEKATYGVLERIRSPERGIAYGVARPYGDGVPILLCIRESRRHGEGAQGVFIPNDERGACDMRSSETLFGMLQDRGKRGVPVEDLYRQLYNPALYLRAYGRIYANDGAMTKGSTPETADAMALSKIERIIEDLRNERYRWTPVRRASVPKKNGKMRPLGLPSFSDKLLQEVIRSLLEAYYEPQFQ